MFLGRGKAFRLRASDGSLCLSSDLQHDVFTLTFGDIFDDDLEGLFELRVLVDLLHETFAHALLSLEFLDFVENDGSFKSIAWHALDIGPVFWILTDVSIDLGINLRVTPKSCLIGGTCRCGFWFGHN